MRYSQPFLKSNDYRLVEHQSVLNLSQFLGEFKTISDHDLNANMSAHEENTIDYPYKESPHPLLAVG